MQELRPTATLRALHDAGGGFILVGGLAAVLNGAPVNTFDVDIVHSRDTANVAPHKSVGAQQPSFVTPSGQRVVGLRQHGREFP